MSTYPDVITVTARHDWLPYTRDQFDDHDIGHTIVDAAIAEGTAIGVKPHPTDPTIYYVRVGVAGLWSSQTLCNARRQT